MSTSSENRIEQRHAYCHRLSLTINRHFARGVVLDWSAHGLQILSRIPIEAEETSLRVRFHIEKFKGISGLREVWSREGYVRWIRHAEEGWYVGIQLDEIIDPALVKEIEKYITEEDSCYLYFFPDTPAD
ncbi:PilZ domain-containing protein [Deltaproteobacteria bacterium TL4]